MSFATWLFYCVSRSHSFANDLKLLVTSMTVALAAMLAVDYCRL
jgi:hypothetical protein